MSLFYKDATSFLSLVDHWIDPFPKPIIEIHEGFQIVRDDLIGFGSKARFIDALVHYSENNEWVFEARS